MEYIFIRGMDPNVILSCTWSTGVMLCYMMMICPHYCLYISLSVSYYLFISKISFARPNFGILQVCHIIGALVIIQIEPYVLHCWDTGYPSN